MTDRPIITIVLRPTREIEIAPALRSLLKHALRCYGLRAVNIDIAPPDDPGTTEERNMSRQACLKEEPVDVIYVRMPRCLHTRIKALAKESNLSINAWTIRRIERCLLEEPKEIMLELRP